MSPSEITDNVRLIAQDRLTSEELENEILVYDPESDKTYNFNGTGAFVWSLANGEYTLGEMIEAIHEAAPETDREVIREDVEEFIRKLRKNGLISLHHGNQ